MVSCGNVTIIQIRDISLYAGAEMIALAEAKILFEQPWRLLRVSLFARATYIAIFIVTTLETLGANGNEQTFQSRCGKR
jgi:hypothetical protein